MDPHTELSCPAKSSTIWRPLHAFVMAVICMAIGFAIGYFLRASTPPTANSMAVVPPASPASVAPDAAAPKTPTLDDMKREAHKQVQPLLTELQKKPNDAVLLNKTALTFKAAHQFDKAAEYFKKSLEADPKNIAVRADYASCLYYMGHVDGALAQLQKSLTYDPKHPGTLFNIGMIEWNGKGDVDAAVAAWQKLLKVNPNLPQKNKDEVEHLIETAKQSKGAVTEKQ